MSRSILLSGGSADRDFRWPRIFRLLTSILRGRITSAHSSPPTISTLWAVQSLDFDCEISRGYGHAVVHVFGQGLLDPHQPDSGDGNGPDDCPFHSDSWPAAWPSKQEAQMTRQFVFQWWTCRARRIPSRGPWARALGVNETRLRSWFRNLRETQAIRGGHREPMVIPVSGNSAVRSTAAR